MLHCRTMGSAERSALLLIHPLGADGTFWNECADLLSERHFLIIPDLRGAGQTPAPERPQSLSEQAGDLAELCASLGVDNVAVLSCAVGAMTAAQLAAEHSDLVQALVLTSPAFKTLPKAREMLIARARQLRDKGVASLLPQALDAAFKNVPEEIRERYARHFIEQDAEGYALNCLTAADADASAAYGKIQCPTLLIAGGMDVLLSAEDHAVPAHRAVARSELITYADGAHFIPYQQPARFAATALDFLQRAIPA